MGCLMEHHVSRVYTQIFNYRKRITLISSALFASHPIHVESIASIVGRADVGAAVFYILSIMCYIKYCKYSDSNGKTHNTYLYTSLVLATLSMLTKEHGITALGVCAVYHLFIHYKLFPLTPETIYAIISERRYKYLRKGIIHLILSGIILIGVRVGVMGSTPMFAPSDNPASDSPSVIIRFLTFLYLPVFNFWLLIYPRYLSFDWSMESIPLIQSMADSRNIISLIFYMSLIFLLKFLLQYYYNKCSEMKQMNDNWTTGCGCAPCCYQHQHHSHYKHLKRPFNLKSNNNNSLCSEDEYNIGGTNNNGVISGVNSTLEETYNSTMTRTDCITMALSLLIIPFIPATNLFFYVGFVIAERILYIPSFGYCLLIAIGIDSLLKRKTIRFVTFIALSLLLISFSLRTFIRNIDWLSEENLYRSGIDINPPKESILTFGSKYALYFIAYGNLANILSAQSKKKEAENAYKKALTYRFNMADVHYNLVRHFSEDSYYPNIFLPKIRVFQHIHRHTTGYVFGSLVHYNRVIDDIIVLVIARTGRIVDPIGTSGRLYLFLSSRQTDYIFGELFEVSFDGFSRVSVGIYCYEYGDNFNGFDHLFDLIRTYVRTVSKSKVEKKPFAQQVFG
ncbi:unnamed protein product [Medioppia subpectinata]|uniref:DUF1736 domain-containing protein n=1 Tax=Medioppia subpectinata TaxID=1979941 RepID=A0A7R9KWU9_9ACAR|nr:unnamed protein product [Medioppia subpectinata]CAG2111276.1 unnamed protein product [Medioppia subpectinata]